MVDGSNLYGHHDRLNLAEVACEYDSLCIGIFDASHGQKGPFQLVSTGFMTSTKSTPLRIYAKKEYDGE